MPGAVAERKAGVRLGGAGRGRGQGSGRGRKGRGCWFCLERGLRASLESGGGARDGTASGGGWKRRHPRCPEERDRRLLRRWQGRASGAGPGGQPPVPWEKSPERSGPRGSPAARFRRPHPGRPLRRRVRRGVALPARGAGWPGASVTELDNNVRGSGGVLVELILLGLSLPRKGIRTYSSKDRT